MPGHAYGKPNGLRRVLAYVLTLTLTFGFVAAAGNFSPAQAATNLYVKVV